MYTVSLLLCNVSLLQVDVYRITATCTCISLYTTDRKTERTVTVSDVEDGLEYRAAVPS